MTIIKKLLLAAAMLLPSLGAAQTTSFWTDRAVGVSQFNGFSGLVPLQYAQVRVCGPLPVTTPSPCQPVAQVYDINGNSLPINGGNFGQITTDVAGRFSFQAASGNYQIQVAATGSNTPQLSYPISITSTSLGAAPVTFNYTVTSVGSGLQIPSTMTLNLDAFSGGVNNILTTKTQWQALRYNVIGRTIGERKGIQGFTNCYGKGDCIGVYGLAFDSGGYLTGGDEGTHGGDFWAIQGPQGGAVPTGTVTAVGSGTVTISWNAGTGAIVGEQRPIIITNRGVYTTGTINSTGIVGAYQGNVCGVTGNAGTNWGNLGTLGLPIGERFLDITGNDNGAYHDVVPIVFLTDDTHIITEYNLAELGATCYGSTMITNGAYKIYLGQVATSGSNPDSSGNPQTFNLLNNVGPFQVGDIVEQPYGYNFHGTAVQAVIQRFVGEPQGGGFYINNVGTPQFRDAYRASGNFQRGMLFDSGSVGLSSWGIEFAEPVGGALIRMTDNTAASQQLINIRNAGGTQKIFIYDRTNDWWNLSNFFVDATGNRLSTNSNPQPNIWFYGGYTGAGTTGLVIAPGIPNAGIPQIDSQNGSGQSVFRVEGNGSKVFLGIGSTPITFVKSATDTPGAITVNAGTCTDRGVAMAGIGTGATISVAANYALEANLGLSPAQAVAGTAHYRICNPTGANITLAAGATFNLMTVQ